jgi:hypothetical protein
MVSAGDGWVTDVVVILTCERHRDSGTYGMVERWGGRGTAGGS